MKRIIYLLATLLFFNSINAQNTDCGTNDPAPSVILGGPACSQTINYAPDELTDVKYVRITFHVLQNDFGDSNVTNNSAGIDYLIQIVDEMNNRMKYMLPMNLPTTSPYFENSKIEFVLENFYFHQNTLAWDFSTGIFSNDRTQIYNQYVTNNPLIVNKTNSIHVFLTSDMYPYNSSGPPFYPFTPEGIACGIPCSNHTFIGGVPRQFSQGNFWDPARLLRHELLHNLGLYHTWYGDNCADTPNNPNCWNYFEPITNPACSIPSNNMMDYNVARTALTECQLGIVHYNLVNNIAINKLVANDYCNKNASVIINNGLINTWYNSRYISGDLIIKANSTLIVKCDLYLPKDAKIIVEQGAKLVVDEGKITNKCGQLWEGIEVWGNSSTIQADASTHGILEVKNNAIIENARVAVSLHKRNANGSGDLTTTGGIVVATNSTFKNNLSAIDFLPYQNHVSSNPNVKLHETSAFINCVFSWDGTGNMVALGELPDAHMTINGIHGIRIEGNDFKSDELTYVDESQRGFGIITIDADGYINEFCTSSTAPCPIAQEFGNTFEDLFVGIDVVGMSNLSRVLIKKNTFTNNRYGVVLAGSKYTTVNQNVFNLPTSTYPLTTGGDAIGIYATGAGGFNIEENNFYTIFGSSGSSNYGIVVNNSDGDGGLVYKNNFDNNIVGTLSSQDNSLLKVDCNNYFEGALHQYDWAITSGTLMNQGSCLTLPLLKPANNTFINCTTGGEANIFSTGAPFIYSSLAIDMPNCVSPSVLLNQCGVNSNQNTCPSNITNPLNPTQIIAILGNIKNEIAALTLNFDGGNTTELLTTITTASNGITKNALLAASPYLTDKVLITYLNTTGVPLGHIKQVVEANSPVTDKVMGIIESMNLPSGIKNQIDAIQTGISERMLLENDINYLTSEYLQLKNEYIRQSLDALQFGDVKNRLADGGTNQDKADLLRLVIADDQQQATSLISELRNEADTLRAEDVNSMEAEKIEKVCDFFDNVKNRIVQTGSFDGLTTSAEQNMRNLCSANGAIAINAQNTLRVFLNEYVNRFAEPIITNSGARLMLPETSNSKPETQNWKLTNYPNPFNSSTIIATTLPIGSVGKIIINDISGKQLFSFDINHEKNKIELTSNQLETGIYFYSLWLNDELKAVNKMVRTK